MYVIIIPNAMVFKGTTNQMDIQTVPFCVWNISWHYILVTFSVSQVGLRNIGVLWLASLRLAGAKLDKWFTKVDSIGCVFQSKIKGVYIYYIAYCFTVLFLSKWRWLLNPRWGIFCWWQDSPISSTDKLPHHLAGTKSLSKRISTAT